ncbi:hypothetical protein D1N53_24510, partial [Clostridioides difficile]
QALFILLISSVFLPNFVVTNPIVFIMSNKDINEYIDIIKFLLKRAFIFISSALCSKSTGAVVSIKSTSSKFVNEIEDRGID